MSGSTSMGNQAQAPVPRVAIPRNQRLQLPPIDHTISRSYVQFHLCFPFGECSIHKEITRSHVRHAYYLTTQRWPFLAGEVIPYNASEQDVLEVKYRFLPTSGEAGKWVRFRDESFQRRTCTYELLMKWGAPPGWLPDHPATLVNDAKYQLSKEGFPASALTVTFIDGGVVLSFAIHRAVMDGPSVKQFLQVFALCLAPTGKRWTIGADERLQNRRAELDFLLSRAETLPQDYDAVSHCEEYTPTAVGLEPSQAGRTVIFEFKHIRVQVLKNQVMHFLKQSGSEDEVSITDCICGLIWVAVMRVRAHRLHGGVEVKFRTVVDARSRVSRPLTNYMGNLTVDARAKTTLEDLIGRESCMILRGGGTPHQRQWQPKLHEVLGARNDIELQSIAYAALAIRKAIAAVDEDYVKHRMAISPDDAAKIRTTEVYSQAVDAANTGVDFLSWEDWLEPGFDPSGTLAFEDPPHALDGRTMFVIPGALSFFPEFVRTSNPQTEGSCILLPRRTGGEKGEDAAWEVALCLRAEEITRVRFVTELGGWAHSTFDREPKKVFGGKRRRNTVRTVRREGDGNHSVRDKDGTGEVPPGERQHISGPGEWAGEPMDLEAGWAGEPMDLEVEWAGEPMDLTED